ncbi:hypothetical protein Pan258_29480 [Symmachiella dynata]|uniref:SMI1/KNR4 family protein n=1 Tax=Symmachiella dynata TaxID=2527995 RepID=UPI001187B1FD|nr:SMI1/KNR4 family protein [Symmachiella dynata]QDT48901.1 hypothetical protein Pan258_29480 [Symmachiella dynata]
MELNRDYVHSRLRQLAKLDRKRDVFGSAEHNYRLNPPLGVDAVESFESEHRITLPEDYKRFIAEIGNGGAGPYYGLHQMGHDESGPWESCNLVGDLSIPFPHLTAWNGDGSLWESEPDIPGHISEEDEDRLMEQWDQILEEEYWSPKVVSGAVPISEIGCNLRQWLVVSGGQSGFVWNDYRADQAGLFPLIDSTGKQMSFTDWYSAWLDTPTMKMPKP